MSASSSKLAFFRQTGWMVIATTLGGAFMFAVHFFARRMPETEYGVLGTLLQIVNLMGIPAIGLQTVFAQQTAAAFSDTQKQQLRGTIRAVLIGTFLIWALMASAIFLSRDSVLRTLQIAHPAGLWVTVCIGLAQMWLPVVLGLLQGQQNFLWLGWTSILNGVGRFLAVALIVTLIGGSAAGVMSGALLGMSAAVVIAIWQSRSVWQGRAQPFETGAWLGRVVPLTLGLGAGQFMLSADMIFVQSFFDRDQTGLYVAAGMIGRALVFFTVPMTAVMFPKIVQSAARAEKTNVLAQALAATALLGGLGAIGLTLFPRLPLLLVQGKKFVPIAWLIPWFAWCMLPLTLANVLMNNLLARGQFAVVPWLVVIAAAYAAALCVFHQSFLTVVQTLGIFSFLLLVICMWFTWGAKVLPPNKKIQHSVPLPKL